MNNKGLGMYDATLEQQHDALQLIISTLRERSNDKNPDFSSTKCKFEAINVPYTRPELFKEMLEHTSATKQSSICVMFSIELAEYLYMLGYEDITLITDEKDSTIDAIIGKLPRYKYNTIKELGVNVKFDVVIGNPPYQNGSDKKFYVEFLNKAKELAPVNAFVIPVSFFDDQSKFKEIAVFKNLGRYFGKNAKMGVCYFVRNKSKTTTKLIDCNGQVLELDDVTSAMSRDVKDYSIHKKIEAFMLSTNNSGWQLHNGSLDLGVADANQVINGIKCITSAGKPKASHPARYQKEDFTWWMVDPKFQSEVEGEGLHKVIVSADSNPEKIGAIKYASTEFGCGNRAYFMRVANKEEATNLIAYLNSNVIKALVRSLKAFTAKNSKTVFKQIPYIDLSKQWSDGELCALFGLSPEHIAHIKG
jgi:hypothetical protein